MRNEKSSFGFPPLRVKFFWHQRVHKQDISRRSLQRSTPFHGFDDRTVSLTSTVSGKAKLLP
jgi:hypothetical protein